MCQLRDAGMWKGAWARHVEGTADTKLCRPDQAWQMQAPAGDPSTEVVGGGWEVRLWTVGALHGPECGLCSTGSRKPETMFHLYRILKDHPPPTWGQGSVGLSG